MIGRLNHIGVVTPSIERSVAMYRDLLGATEIGEAFDLPAKKVRVCFVDLPNSQTSHLKPALRQGILHIIRTCEGVSACRPSA